MIRLATFAALVMLAELVIGAEPKQVRAIGELAAERLGNWSLHHVDSEPSVRVADRAGYRIVLRQSTKVYPQRLLQQKAEFPRPDEPFEWRHEDWEIVLVDFQRRLPANASQLARTIKFASRETGVHLRHVYLGTSGNFGFYTLASIYDQEQLRDELNLLGGDDRIQLAIDGLSIQDEGSRTANSVSYLIARFGDAALPYLDRALAQGGDVRRHILTLGTIPTPGATERLMELYRNGVDVEQNAAATALCYSWQREAAKPVYLQMIRDRRLLREASETAVAFGWAEAIEPLQQAVADPPTLFEYSAAFRALRQLEGNAVPPQIDAATQRIKQAGYASGRDVDEIALQAGVQQLLDSSDTSAALVAALELATFTTKGNVEAVNAAGIEVLNKLPRPTVKATLQSLATNLDQPREREVVEQLLTQLD